MRRSHRSPDKFSLLSPSLPKFIYALIRSEAAVLRVCLCIATRSGLSDDVWLCIPRCDDRFYEYIGLIKIEGKCEEEKKKERK